MLNEQLSPELQKQIEQEAKSSAADFNYFPGSEECEDLESAYTAGATKYAEKLQEAQQLVERYEKALKAIISPIAYLQRKAVDEGAILDGQMAQYLANNVSFLQAIATKALTPKTGSDE